MFDPLEGPWTVAYVPRARKPRRTLVGAAHAALGRAATHPDAPDVTRRAMAAHAAATYAVRRAAEASRASGRAARAAAAAPEDG